MGTDEKTEKMLRTSSEKEHSKKEKQTAGKSNKYLKTAGLIAIAALLFTIGGPIGIVLGIASLLVACKKPLLKIIKKTYKSISKQLAVKRQAKMFHSKNKRKTNSLEMDKSSFNKMKSRPNSISKIDLIPKERAKSTANDLRFQGLIKPAIDLSEQAMLRRKNQASVAKKTALSNSKNRKPSL